MTNRRALDLVRKLGQAEAALRGREFLVPLVSGGSARLRLEGLIYTFRVPNARSGWWICHMMDARQAVIIAPALPWQRGEYLALWPVVQLVLLHEIRDGSWLALPPLMTGSDPVQQLGVVRLVENGQPFMRVLARAEGTVLWFDDIDHRADPATAEQLRVALAREQVNPQISGLLPGEKAAYALRFEQTRIGREMKALERGEHRVRAALETGGAELLGLERSDNSWRVTWERDGQRSVTLIDPKLNVVSSGICLSGEDAKFDLASIVGVVLDSPWFSRD
jgi:hypothetical protein